MKTPRVKRNATTVEGDTEWLALVNEACVRRLAMPEDVRTRMIGIVGEISDVSDELQVDPRTMAVAMAAVIGGLALVAVGGDAHADEAIDEFLHYCRAAMHVAVAAIRIDCGWAPPHQH